ncbi:hypothetical protein M0805_005584 [Coniferiporia weirii]|nr:hypothetical protein M0805_005584 [Coniferiporia weirii]
MPITEFAVLQLKEGKVWAHILPHIRALMREQAAWSGYELHFFDDADSDVDAARTVYLLSGWASVEAHEQWIASEMNQRLLRDLLPFLDVKSLLHLAIEPSEAYGDA